MSHAQPLMLAAIESDAINIFVPRVAAWIFFVIVSCLKNFCARKTRFTGMRASRRRLRVRMLRVPHVRRRVPLLRKNFRRRLCPLRVVDFAQPPRWRQ